MTSTWTLGFLPQAAATAARTAFSIAVDTTFASRRCGRGKASNVSKQRRVDDLVEHEAGARFGRQSGQNDIWNASHLALAIDCERDRDDAGKGQSLARLHRLVVEANKRIAVLAQTPDAAPRR